MISEVLQSRSAVPRAYGPEDEYRVTVPFLKEALDRKERAFYIVDPEVQADTVRRFREAGVEAKESSDVRDCEICTWRDTYLRGGRFQGAAMLALIEDILTSGRPRFGLTRVIGHVEWAPDDPESTNDLLEYETRLKPSISCVAGGRSSATFAK